MLEEKFREYALTHNKKLGDILMPLRVAITFSRVSPPLFESMKILGLSECTGRIEAALTYLKALILVLLRPSFDAAPL